MFGLATINYKERLKKQYQGLLSYYDDNKKDKLKTPFILCSRSFPFYGTGSTEDARTIQPRKLHGGEQAYNAQSGKQNSKMAVIELQIFVNFHQQKTQPYK